MRAKEFLYESVDQQVIRLQRELLAAGADLGTYGPAQDGIDGRMGPKTQSAMRQFPLIADKYQQALTQVGPNPNIDNATRSRARDSVQDLDQTDSGSIRPVDGRVTSAFGNRRSPTGGASSNHPGVDLASATGTAVHAPISGQVVYAKMDDNACGGTIAIYNAMDKIKHRFCHCSKINVVVGQSVQQGDVVGLTGGGANDPGRGTSTGPHLHWEKQVAGALVDPMANIG